MEIPAYSGSIENPNVYSPGIMSKYWQTGNIEDRFNPLMSDIQGYAPQLPTTRDLANSPASKFTYDPNYLGGNFINNPIYNPTWNYGDSVPNKLATPSVAFNPGTPGNGIVQGTQGGYGGPPAVQSSIKASSARFNSFTPEIQNQLTQMLDYFNANPTAWEQFKASINR